MRWPGHLALLLAEVVEVPLLQARQGLERAQGAVRVARQLREVCETPPEHQNVSYTPTFKPSKVSCTLPEVETSICGPEVGLEGFGGFGRQADLDEQRGLAGSPRPCKCARPALAAGSPCTR